MTSKTKELKIKKQTSKQNRSSLHILIIIAIGIAVWAISNAGHEIIGHGGVCALDSLCVGIGSWYWAIAPTNSELGKSVLLYSLTSL